MGSRQPRQPRGSAGFLIGVLTGAMLVFAFLRPATKSQAGWSLSWSGAGASGGSNRCTIASCRRLAEEEAAAQRPARYSTFTCAKSITSAADWQNSTCTFHNLCFNTNKQRFEYYVDPSLPDIPLLQTPAGELLRRFPAKLVDAGWPKDHAPWHPTVVRSAFPKGPRVKWAPTPQALLIDLCTIPEYLLHNFGHILYDIVVPLFNMQHMFGVYTPKAQPLTLGDCTADKEKLVRKLLPMFINTPRPDMSILRLHWDNDLSFAADYAEQVLDRAGGGHVCFKTVLVGTGPLSRRIPGPESWPYREAAVWRLGLQEKPQQRPVITVLKKRGGMTVLDFETKWKHNAWMRPGRRSVENTEDVVSALQARYGPHVTVNLLECCDGERMTVPDQVKLMSETSVLITPGGGIASVLNFLRPSATAIPLTAFNTQTNRSVSLDYVFYPQMESPRIVEFPISLKEYEGTSDRPGCELTSANWRYAVDGALIHCNLRFGPEGLHRLQLHVDAALLHWAEHNGRYEVLEPLQRLAAEQQR